MVPVGTRRAWALVLAVAAVAAVSLTDYFRSSVWAVEVGGKVVGFVSERAEASEALAAIVREAEAETGMDVRPSTALTLRRVTAPAARMGTDLLSQLRAAISMETVGCAISIGGERVVVLKDEETARAAIASVERAYVASVEQDRRSIVHSLSFREDITFGPVHAVLEDIRSLETARLILERGTDQVNTYTVKSGDSLWSIATANQLTIADLRAANPDLTSDFIRTGQQLSMVVPKPYLTISSTERRVVIESIPFAETVSTDDTRWPWDGYVLTRGVAGAREVTYEIVRENMKEVSRTLQSSTLIREPVTQHRVAGTKLVPAMGTGRFVWPLMGQLTSPFGPRVGGFHSGIDIAAPLGTEIMAADAGIVVFSGIRGLYGNLVIVDHGGGSLVTYYAHNSKNLVRVGDTVVQGQVIALVGRTGRSTGPHLHFEVRVDGRFVNPLTFYPR
ncbi:MAG: M23 family metallopeptidase [Bacillota bacterium]